MDGGQGKTMGMKGTQSNTHRGTPTEMPSKPSPRAHQASAEQSSQITESSNSTGCREHNRVPASPVSKKCAVPEAARAPQEKTTLADSTPTLTDRHTDNREKQIPSNKWQGLHHPTLSSGARVDGTNKHVHRRENKKTRIAKQEQQEETSYWAWHQGQFTMPTQTSRPPSWRNNMCPSNLALHHPAADTLLQYAAGGCPTNKGKNWTREQMQEAIDRGPHASANTHWQWSNSSQK